MEYDTIWANNKSDVHRMAKAYGLVTETDTIFGQGMPEPSTFHIVWWNHMVLASTVACI
jgi:hypothetical protein